MACSGDRFLGLFTKVHALLGILKPRGFKADLLHVLWTRIGEVKIDQGSKIQTF